MEDWESGNVTASGGELQCLCSVFLPAANFPADRVQHMQQVTTELKREVEIQMNNVSLVCLELLKSEKNIKDFDNIPLCKVLG